MSNVISFPNFLCLLLIGALVVHLTCRDHTEGSLPDSLYQLEEIYCRLPQSGQLEDTARCSSAQKLFLLLGNDCSLELKKKRAEEITGNETEAVDTGEELEELEEHDEVVTVEIAEEEAVGVSKEQEEEVKSSLVDSFIISLLVCSAIVSLLEWYREKTKDNRQVPVGDGGNTIVGSGDAHSDRRISLADLTVNRHIRRGDSQQMDMTRQNSTPSGSNKPPLLRRSSFPAQLPEVRTRHAPQRQQSTPASPVGRRMSVDLGEDDGSPDRRRVRIIRRH